MKKLLQSAAAGLLLASVVTTASAASYSFDFTPMAYIGPQPSFNYAYGDNQSLTISGVSGYWGPNKAENIYQWGHWGVYVDGGTHMTTNFNNSYQALVLDFGQAVTLDTFTLSHARWADGYNHVSLLALSDLNAPLNFSAAWGGLLDNGWEHAGRPDAYKGLSVGDAVAVQGNILSRYWLISAYNPVFGGGSDKWGHGFKLGGLSFTVHDVSEIPLPAAAWLFLTGLAGMGWMKKRKAKREAAELSAA
ncbi:MAG: VPLPA-CTERM sorting domain-containing protein [Nitrincola sp.]|nr:VPLPA-CTERM sorting domain-containing protein [Nitrincola sp.]